MKIQYASDIHLEFQSNSDYIKHKPLKPEGDYLILTGDITVYNEKYFKNRFFDKVSDDFKEVFIVPGNHEYYGGFDVSLHENGFKESIRDNVHFINNRTVQIDDVDFIFTTLWSALDSKYLTQIVRGLNDFYRIKRGKSTIEPSDYDELYKKSLQFINNALLSSKAKKRVVATHHVPSHMCNPGEFEGSKINSAFVNTLDLLIEHNNIDYWIYGHHHRNLSDIKLGNTMLVTNQLGYVDYEEHYNFKRGKWFEI